MSEFAFWELSLQDWEEIEWAVPEEKDENTFRIFVFGGSAAEGWPTPYFSFSRFLNVMLHEVCPEVNFEVYNTAFMGLNSHIMRAQALQYAQLLEPDLFLIYMGNNEFLGPFSPVPEKAAPLQPGEKYRPMTPLWRIRLMMRMADFRLVQLSRQVMYGWLKIPEPKTHWVEEAAVYPNDPRAPQVLADYRSNLTDMVQAAQKVGAQVLVSTLAANIRDWRPTYAAHLTSLTGEAQTTWDRYYREGKASQEQGQYAKALESYGQAAAISEQHAALAFDQGLCFSALGRSKEAGDAFRRALELDSFANVRARKTINAIVKEVVAQQTDEQVYAVDLASVMDKKSPDGVAGREFFWDNCHFNLRGSYEAAAALCAAMLKNAPQWLQAQCEQGRGLPDFETAVKKIGMHPDSGLLWWGEEVEDDIFYSPAGLTMKRDAVRRAQAMQPSPKDLETARCSTLVQQDEGDFLVWRHALGAQAVSEQGVPLELAQAMADRFPLSRFSQRTLAETLQKRGKQDEALALYKRIVAQWPDDTPSLGALNRQNTSTEKRGPQPQARPLLEEVSQLIQNGELAPAEEKILAAQGVCKDAQFYEAQFRLAAAKGEIDTAVSYCRKAIEAGNASAAPYEYLYAWHRDHNTVSQSLEEWKAYVDKTPQSTLAHHFLARTQRDLGHWREAAQAYRKTLELEANDAVKWLELAEVLRQFESTSKELVSALEKSISLNPNLKQTWQYLVETYVDQGECSKARETIENARSHGIEIPSESMGACR